MRKTELKTRPARKRPNRARRTNVERSATTRSKLIEAAIELLYSKGYSRTTTISVAAKARVSRGAMLHQFPTRVKLLLAVAEHVSTEQIRYRREQLAPEKFASGIERVYAAGRVSWDISSQPSAIALLEIIMATRSDSALRRGFEAFASYWAGLRKTAAIDIAKDLGITDIGKVVTLIRLNQASLLGLSIEMMFSQNKEVIETERVLLAQYERHHMAELIAATK